MKTRTSVRPSAHHPLHLFLCLIQFNKINGLIQPQRYIRQITSNQIISHSPPSRLAFLPLHSTKEKNGESCMLPEPLDLKLREIQSELKDRGVSYTDCFDRDSLTKRLIEARSSTQLPANDKPEPEPEPEPERTTNNSAETTATVVTNFDRDATLLELRSLRVPELRSRLGSRNIRWATMLEKEELVQALLNSLEISAGFSLSGALVPGKVEDITGEELGEELATSTSTPFLLDVYATWCGPCQLVAPQLVSASEELGDKVRMAKMDSDKHPDWAGKLKVGGLPTLILFDGDGKEIDRVEGALMKDGIIDLLKRKGYGN